MRFSAPVRPIQGRRGAVTLVEILTVTAIIMILSTLGFYAFTTATGFGSRLEMETKLVAASIKPDYEKSKLLNRGSTQDPNGPSGPGNAIMRRLRAMPRAPRGNDQRAHQLVPNLLYGNDVFINKHQRKRTFASFSASGALVSSSDSIDLALAAYARSNASATRQNNPDLFLDGSFVAAPAGNDFVWRNYPSTSAFLLHSNPGAKHVIYMDFDGHTTAGTLWNTQFNNGNPFTTPAWSMDGNRAAFSTVELDKIIILWRMVAEDFMPFDVDVTTQDPGLASLKFGMRAVIGPDPGAFVAGAPNPWPNAGGLAFLNTFNSPNDIPCFAWNGDSTPNPESTSPVTVSHEVGHTLGLDHDGDSGALGYYLGHGAGVTGWGPIMGAPFGKNVTQWSRNTYPTADNPEDDLAIIAANGLGYRPDDYGNTPSSAKALNAVLQGQLNTTYGIIEKDTDVDYFTFGADPGPINIKISPLFVGPNLDIQAELYDSSSNLLLTSNPAAALDATFATTVTGKGNYYIKVKGAALLPLTTGYPTYGCLGNYKIEGDVTPLTPTFASFKTANPLRWRYNRSTGTFDGMMTIGNVTKDPFNATFNIIMTLPHPSIIVANPIGVQVGQTYTVTYTGLIGPSNPFVFPISLYNPTNYPLTTGLASYVTDIKSK